MSRVAHSLLWDGPPLPPAPSYGVGVFERKERANDHRDPWNRPGQEPEQHCWPGCGGTGRPAPTRETGDPCRTCRQAPTRSDEQTSELQSLMRTSYAVFSCKQKHKKATAHNTH